MNINEKKRNAEHLPSVDLLIISVTTHINTLKKIHPVEHYKPKIIKLYGTHLIE